MSVLITAASSASAHKLKNKLNRAEVTLGDHAELPDFMLKNMGLVKLPNPSSPSYQHEMLTLCLDAGISEIHALTATELNLLMQSELLFNEYGITIHNGFDEI